MNVNVLDVVAMVVVASMVGSIAVRVLHTYRSNVGRHDRRGTSSTRPCISISISMWDRVLKSTRHSIIRLRSHEKRSASSTSFIVHAFEMVLFWCRRRTQGMSIDHGHTTHVLVRLVTMLNLAMHSR